MKTALSALALSLCVSLSGAAEESSHPESAKSARSGHSAAKHAGNSCRKCTHAPCRCGFSPSYYTHHRRPVRWLSSTVFSPIRPHWTRPTTGTLVPSPRPPRTVPAVQPTQRLGFAPGLVFRPPFAFDDRLSFRPTGALFGCTDAGRLGRRSGHERPGFDSHRGLEKHLLHRERSGAATIGTIVPSPRRARVVPAVTPTQSLGYDPCQSWSRRIIVSRAHRPGRGR